MMNSEPDLSVIEQARQGDAHAWELLVRKHSRRIYSLCHRYAGKSDQAEDLTQEAFLRIFRHLHQFRPETGSFVNWISRITRNLLIDHYRKNRVAQESCFSAESPLAEGHASLEAFPSGLPSPESELVQGEQRQALERALSCLSPQLREAVVLRYLRELSYREMAARMKVSDGTVKSRINRGKAELARQLQLAVFAARESYA
jgi:RNA polymerase sigma-70 factor (ECF subfamily)